MTPERAKELQADIDGEIENFVRRPSADHADIVVMPRCSACGGRGWFTGRGCCGANTPCDVHCVVEQQFECVDCEGTGWEGKQ